MAKPYVEFTQAPPIQLSSAKEAEVHVTVHPNAVGDCEVTLSLLMSSCTFQNDLMEITEIVTAENADDKIEFIFTVIMKSPEPDLFFTLLFCRAVNAEGQRSFRKPIETEIDCRQLFIESPSEPII